MTYIWVFVSFVVATLVRFDARFLGPYFSYSAVVYGYPELASQHTTRSIWYGLVRRAVYPALGGLVLSLASRNLLEAVLAGSLSMLLLIWPVVFHGFPPAISKRRAVVLYVALLITGGAAGGAGWYVGDAFGSVGGLLAYARDQAGGALFMLALTAFGTAIAGKAGSSH